MIDDLKNIIDNAKPFASNASKIYPYVQNGFIGHKRNSVSVYRGFARLENEIARF